jgi:hypothetical protein
MRRIKSVLGFAWAAAAVPVVLASFVGMNFWAARLASATGITISPRFTGGEVRQTLDRGSYQILVHDPVFQGLLGPRNTGFVQIDCQPKPGNKLPPEIEETIDADGSGRATFDLRLDTSTGRSLLTPHSPAVLNVSGSFPLEQGWGVRVNLRRPAAR